MAVAEVPESKRFCPACGSPVGRSRGDAPGRTDGFCPKCRTQFSFSPKLHPGDLVAGQYEVVGCLAHGGLGWVYLGRDKNVSDRYVVLKGLLNSGDVDAYQAAIAERQFLAEVEHPAILEIYNFVIEGGAGYIVMEFVGGKSLKQILKDRMRANGGTFDAIPVDQALAYIIEILPAFAYLHATGLLYCDFKPDNIIQQNDTIKLIDLGGVRRSDDLTSAIYGTVGYQAPEVAELGPSVASDIYTIGRTLAVLAMEFRGFQTTYVDSLPAVEDTPLFQRYDSFYRALAKACAANPDDRFQSADEMREQLLGVLREVVAADSPSQVARQSAASTLFDAPVVAGDTLDWEQLPALKVDLADPMATWLAGVSVPEPMARLEALGLAAQETVEVQLARARAALELERFDLVESIVAAILTEDPWEWRGVWVSGLANLAGHDAGGAVASFNAAYGQVPGELAVKLALAVACEQSGQPDAAEQLYSVCAETDANYTAPAAFGLARIRIGRGDIAGALEALDLVAPTSRSYVDARRRRAALLAEQSQGLTSLAAAIDSVENVSIDPIDRQQLLVRVLSNALAEVRASGSQPKVLIGGIRADERSLRDGAEAAYRQLAGMTEDRVDKIALVDKANKVRRWTLT
jgi:serine/threonine-protein kinase PknG